MIDSFLKDDVNNCFIENILLQILIDNDAEDYLNDDSFEAVTNFFNDCEYSQIEISDKIENIFEEDILDNVINGNGEYWRQEYNIYNLNDYLQGNEFDIAKDIIRKRFGL